MIFVGIDPGKNMGVAVVDAQKNTCFSFTVEKGKDLIDAVKEVYDNRESPMLFVVEQQQPMGIPKAFFSVGHSMGYVEALLDSLGYPYTLVKIASWQRKILGKCAKGSTKEAAKKYSERRFPDKVKRTEHEHDAICIECYGMMISGAIR